MMISTKGRYALRVMIDLAESGLEEYVPLKEIADREEISRKYLENIMMKRGSRWLGLYRECKELNS
mgnify:CR=1 FL=1